MNYLKLLTNNWKEFWKKRKEYLEMKHSSRMFNIQLGIAIEKCQNERRKFFIVQKSKNEWELIGNQEYKKAKKFKEAKLDKDFMQLEELSTVVCAENLPRLIEEHRRRKWYAKWYNMMTHNYYEPVTEWEMVMLEKIYRSSTDHDDRKFLNEFMAKHR